MMRVIKTLWLVSASLVVTAMVAVAQQNDPQGPPMRGPAAERVEQWRKVRLIELLKLDDESSIRFFNRYNKHQEELQDIQQKREELLRQLGSFQRSNAADEEIEKTLQDFRALDGKMIEARDRYWKDIRTVLTVKQFARYVIFENTFNRQLRELMRDMQQERMDRMQRRPR